jgi:hypothetical protein
MFCLKKEWNGTVPQKQHIPSICGMRSFHQIGRICSFLAANLYQKKNNIALSSRLSPLPVSGGSWKRPGDGWPMVSGRRPWKQAAARGASSGRRPGKRVSDRRLGIDRRWMGIGRRRTGIGRWRMEIGRSGERRAARGAGERWVAGNRSPVDRNRSMVTRIGSWRRESMHSDGNRSILDGHAVEEGKKIVV